MRRLTALLVLLLVLGGVAILGLRLLATRPGPLPQAANIVVPRGHLNNLTTSLQRSGLLPQGDIARLLFIGAARVTGRHAALHAAEFHFPAHVSILQLLEILRHARPVQHEITIPEGLTAAQIADIVMAAPALVGGLDVPEEGELLPETYAYELGSARTVLLTRMHEAMQRLLAATWAGRDTTIPLTEPSQMLSLASIVERETALPNERPLVAEVFLNRIRQGMKLQSDPTVAYGAGGGLGSLPRPLTRSDLVQPNPYNTYMIPGLPPGPISAPGAAALQAVAHPAHGDLLYFVANGSGGHAFAATMADHLRNVAVFRALEAAHPGQTPTLDPLRPPPQVPMVQR